MKKIILTLAAFTAISGTAFAGNDGSNGQSSRDIASSVIYSDTSASSIIVDRAGVVDRGTTNGSYAFPTTVGDREAGASSR